MVSFFTLAGAGFGGYVALDPKVRGMQLLRPIIARMEEAMLRDSRGACGWYIECVAANRALFRHVGFREVPIRYRHPPLRAGAAPVPLHLMYKEFGRRNRPPKLARDAIVRALRAIFREVYDVRRPDSNPLFKSLIRQLPYRPRAYVLEPEKGARR